jgi:uncharacterized membrane protein YbaN (DUF454 family)
MTRLIYLSLGTVLLALGIIGAFLPLMPTTIFVILSASCFARSSPRLEAWLMQHPRFGPGLRMWREHGAISRAGKIAACIGMTVGFVIFWIGSHPGPWLATGVATVLIASAIYVVSRPGVPGS